MYNVLIIENSLFIQGLLQKGIEELEMTCIGLTRDVKTGIELFCQHRPDAVIVGHTIGEKKGIDIAEEILKQDFYARIILVAPYHTLDESQKLIARGIKAVLPKPFYPRQLQSQLIEVIMS